MKLHMENFSLIRRMSQFGTWMQTWFCGAAVGRDQFGNRYYRDRHTPKGVREKRWVMYAGEPEASKVPPEWHIWLHHTADVPLLTDNASRKPWQIPYQPNRTGTPQAYFPPGHVLSGEKAVRTTGVYQAWQPTE